MQQIGAPKTNMKKKKKKKKKIKKKGGEIYFGFAFNAEI